MLTFHQFVLGLDSVNLGAGVEEEWEGADEDADGNDGDDILPCTGAVIGDAPLFSSTVHLGMHQWRDGR